MKLALTFPGCHKRAGIERVMLESANYLARHGHEVRVYAQEFDYSALDPRVDARLVTVPKIPLAAPMGLFAERVEKQLEAAGPELLCTFGTVCPTGGILWVPSIHKAWLEISQSSRDFSGRAKQLLNPLHPLLVRGERKHFGLRQYRKLIVHSQQVSFDLQRLYAVPKEDIYILPNGFCPEEFNIERVLGGRRQRRSELGYADSDQVVVFVANEFERKGFVPLVEAIAKLADANIKLLVVGGVDGGTQATRLGKLGLLERTKFIPPTSKVADFFAAGDVFVLPTKYESWGLVIIEALACGLPVVTSKLAGASIAVRDGQNGFLLDQPSNASEIAQKLKKAIYELDPDPHVVAASVSRFKWDTILSEYEKILLAANLPERFPFSLPAVRTERNSVSLGDSKFVNCGLSGPQSPDN